MKYDPLIFDTDILPQFQGVVVPFIKGQETVQHLGDETITRTGEWYLDCGTFPLELLAYPNLNPDLMRFDCRSLDYEFLVATGREAEEEMRHSGEILRFPFPACWFEFAGAGLLTQDHNYHFGPYETDENDELILDEADISIECYSLIPPSVIPELIEGDDAQAWYLLWSYANSIEINSRRTWEEMDTEEEPTLYQPLARVESDLQFYKEPAEDCDKRMEERLRSNVHAALGVLVLMQEKLMNTALVADAPKPFINSKRLRKGKPALTLPPYHVCALNLAETRRRTRGVALKQHESPRLHWRRGHYRTLYRLSEFERQVWVKKCLVGDPTKGFSSTIYRPVWNETVH